MAPSATHDIPSPSSTTTTHPIPRDGAVLEATSDAIDKVNVLKAIARIEAGTASPAEVELYNRSQPQPHPQDHTNPPTQPHSSPTSAAEKDKSAFRRYDDEAATSRVRAFYTEQHTKQTVAYNVSARRAFHAQTRARMTVWQAMEKLNTLLDDSDPDTSLSQIEHLLQSAEAIRRDAKPRWFQLTGLIHDLGKLLYFYGAEGQWDVVGDTFPVGCAFDEQTIVYPGSFAGNPDVRDARYGSRFGIYERGCGLENVMLSWGHDEYLYHVCKAQSTLPEEALAMIRYHSFYPWHTGGGYRWMMDEQGKDERMLEAVRAFNPYDLYSKSDEVPNVDELKEYYMDLIQEFFPPREGETERVIDW